MVNHYLYSYDEKLQFTFYSSGNSIILHAFTTTNKDIKMIVLNEFLYSFTVFNCNRRGG